MGDVSRVIDMQRMFDSASAFNSDISKWDVSSVTNMQGMFNSASSFNSDISKWDVSRVTNIDKMFYRASSFAQALCGKWIRLKSSAHSETFSGSSGEICATESSPKWAPDSKEELKAAVENCELQC